MLENNIKIINFIWMQQKKKSFCIG